MPDRIVLSALARSILAGRPTVDGIVERAGRVLGRVRRPWLRELAERYVQSFSGHLRPRHREVVEWIRADPGYQNARSTRTRPFPIAEWLTETPLMQPVATAAEWNLPAIATSGELAARFGISIGELEWFADLKGLTSRKCDPRLRHYRYKTLLKRSGGVRLIEIPKTRLKDIQRSILSSIVGQIAIHSAAHGFVRGRSIRTFAAPHAGQHVLVRIDLKDFFPTFSGARIQALFRTLGYPESVADLLGGICTNATPPDVWTKRDETAGFYARPHLPQGAPTSPALANLCMYHVDCRLTGLAESAGATYTRYADDLAFSGPEEFARRAERFAIHVAAVLLEEGLAVQHQKTRIMRRGVRQHLSGLAVNEKPNIIRADFDRLKATLTNCVRHGPESQNRSGLPNFRAHLEGRIGFVEMINRAKAARLREIFRHIVW